MSDDAERFAVVDAMRVAPISKRFSDKRNDRTVRRFSRKVGNGYVLRAECGCGHAAIIPGGVCPVCGGAELTPDEFVR